MAISTKNEGGKLTIELDNGHVEALKKIVKDYNLVDEKAAVGFMLAVISEGEGQEIKINTKSFLPSEKIIKPKEKQTNG